MKNVNFSTTTSSAATFNGAQIDASQMYQASITSIFTDVASTGTVKLQMSNAPCTTGTQTQSFTVPSNSWQDIPNATSTVTAGVAPPIILPVVAARWIRVVFTRTGGAGTVTVTVFAICV